VPEVARPRVDAHLHLWDLARGGYDWLTPDLGPLYDSFDAEQARAELDACGVDDAVLVQAEDSVRDTAFLLDVAARSPWVAGVVGWVRLDAPEVAEAQLDRWQQSPALRGVRHLVHDDPRDGFLALPGVRRSLAAVAERGLVLDVPDAWPRHLGATADLAAALPGLTVVLDHLGKPPPDPEAWQRWRTGLARVAERGSTVAKVSGLAVPGHRFDVDTVRPSWDAALELFGPDRLMWGSDWPVSVRTAGYAGTWSVLSALVAELSPHEQAALLHGTARRTYGLPRRDGPGEARR
jgi:L-fuconolactonase